MIMEYKRLTRNSENIVQQFENIKPENRNKFCLECFERLAELEDKIENRTLIEFPRILERKDQIYPYKLEYLDDEGEVWGIVCTTKREAEEQLKRYIEKKKLPFYSGKGNINKPAEPEDKIENGTLIELPCKIGNTIYRIKKACDYNDGYKDEYKCEPEFTSSCQHFVENYDDTHCTYKGNGWLDRIEWCHLNTVTYCSVCKERLCIQKDVFTYDKIPKMFDKTKDYDDYYDVFFTTKEQAEAKLKEMQSKE